MAPTRRRGRRTELEVVQVTQPNFPKRTKATSKTVRHSHKARKAQQKLASKGRASETGPGRRLRRGEGSMAVTRLSPRRNGSPGMSSGSGSESEREQARRTAISQRRRANQEISVGAVVPLSRPVQNAQPPRTPDRPTQPVVDCTPFQFVPNPQKPHDMLARSFSPATRPVVDGLKGPLKLFTATQRPFFTINEVTDYLRPQALELLQKDFAGEKNRIARQDDGITVPTIIRHVSETAGKLRFHVMSEARKLILVHYELLARKPPLLPEDNIQRGARVQELLTDYKFAATDTETGEGLFCHPAIHELVIAALFNAAVPTFNLGAEEAYTDAFKSYPDGLIAFAATAIYAALSEWTQGYRTTVKFEARRYGQVFDNLLQALTNITFGTEERAQFELLRSDWYMNARLHGGGTNGTNTTTALDNIILRNRVNLRDEHARRNAVEAEDGLGDPDDDE